jgi:hypothetical protein
MKSEKLKLQNTELTLVFDRVDLPYQDQDLQITKIIRYFNFKKPTDLLIGEIIRKEDSVKLFDREDEAKEYAKEYISEKYKTYL